MKLGIIGWYKHNNAGDERILYSLERFFQGNDISVFDAFDDALERIEELNRCDFVLIGGGSLIIRRQNKYSELIQKLKPKFGCVGIGVESVHADNIEFINAIKEKAEFILVRDTRSMELLGECAKVLCAPDLTFLYPYEIAPEVKENICGVNLIPWHYWNFEYFGLLHRIMKRIDNKFPQLEAVYPLTKWKPEKAFSSIKNNFSELIPIPFYFEKDRKTDIQAMSRFFKTEIPQEFLPELYYKCRYLVAMRLHALIFSCQMGIPFVSLTYMPKNYGFCKSIEMQDYSIDIYNLSNLENTMEKMRENYGETRDKLLYYREKNKNHITETMNSIFTAITGTQKCKL